MNKQSKIMDYTSPPQNSTQKKPGKIWKNLAWFGGIWLIGVVSMLSITYLLRLVFAWLLG